MLKRLLNLIFPPKCIFCNKILYLNTDIYICKECFSKIEFREGGSIKSGTGDDYFDSIVCVCEYTGIVKDAVKRFKFSNKPAYYRAFARLLSQKIKETMDYRLFDAIISVPLHPVRERTRGYNQSFLISTELSRELGIKEESNLLSRTRNTHSQSLLPRQDRLINVKGAFTVTDSSKVKDKTILLVDDVLTTGTTLNECSRVLKEAGAKKIVVAVIASGRRF
ncbi:MAG TPA: ComF family protein [Acetivibrio sp.]|nr:ComF family protein [Clostridium sp.]HOQ37964.1 ComF family protein [Acetivibrio sp.]HPT91539.1 ComF family protein [Acetivibrio sp.]HQA58843.1 ComF family protein [Acetivibrio sp.]